VTLSRISRPSLTTFISTTFTIGTCSGYFLGAPHSRVACWNCRFVVCPKCRAKVENQTALHLHNCSGRRRFGIASPLRGKCTFSVIRWTRAHRHSRTA
jgi:hypothetical protein